MSAATGRPRGAIPETLQRDREILALCDQGVTTAAIMERVGVSRTEVYRALSRARCAPVEVQPETEEPKPKPRMSERTLVHRAVSAMMRIRAFLTLDAELRDFWLRVVMEIREIAANGTDLSFGNPGDLYLSRGQFAGVFGKSEVDLDRLLRPGFLLDMEGGGIGLPMHFGLRPREKRAGTPGGRGSPDLRQMSFPPLGMPSRYSGTPENFTSESQNIRPKSHETPPPESQNIRPKSHETWDSPARADSLSLSSSSHGLFVQTTEEKEGERESGEGCGEGAPSHEFHGISAKSHALRRNESQARRAKFPAAPAPPPREMRQIPDDFELTAADRREAQRRGYDADAAVEQFRDVCRDVGKFSADWSAAFRAFVRRGIIGPPPQQQQARNMPRPKGEDYLFKHWTSLNTGEATP